MKKKRTRPNEPRVHFKTGTRNGVMFVLCKKSSDLVWKVTEKVSDITCKHCEARVKRL